MGTRQSWHSEHYQAWRAWHTARHGAAHDSGARLTITTNLWSHAVMTYHQLRTLPRRVRRALQRQWACSLAGVALVFTVGGNVAEAATINVNVGCTLINAVTSANTDGSVGGCTAGSGADTIVLPAASTQMLTAAIASPFGNNGLPLITSAIAIQGNGSTIARTGGPDFRLLTVDSTGNLTLQNLTLMGGSAMGAFPNNVGGGVYNTGTLTLANSTIASNSASYGNGGGVYNSGSLTLTNSTVSGNAADFAGGGVYNSGSLTLTNSTVSGNAASTDGGGVFNHGGTVILSNSTVSGNTASNLNAGGGVYNSGSLTLTNSTVSGNAASTDGGGVFNYDGTGTLTNSTVSGNTVASDGGGVYNQFTATLTLNRTLVSGNIGSSGRELFNDLGTITSTNFNVFGFNSDAGCVNFIPTTVGATADRVPTVPVASILNTILAFNGGPTQTHALVTGSPAVDTVTDGTCPPPVTDQRGFVRPFDGDSVGGAQCDSGAFELSAVLPPMQNPQLTFMILPDTRVTIPNANGCPGGFTAKFSFQARLTNLGGMPPLSALKAVVTTLTPPRLLQNADGGPGGVGATLTVPELGGLSDGVLGPTEVVDVPFVICLPNTNSFQLKVDVVGAE